MVTVGTDPEFFLIDRRGDYPEYIPAHHFFAGTKEEPMQVDENVSLLTDNVMLEANVPPASSADELVGNISHIMSVIRSYLPEGIELAIVPDAFFNEKERDDKYYEFGCDPDFNIWTEEPNIPSIPEDKRFAGGHIHIGYDGANPATSGRLVRLLDYYLYYAIGGNSERDQYYGMMGLCRFKDYGVEYRSPSNHWLSENDLIRLVFNKSVECVDMLKQGMDVSVNDLKNHYHVV